MKKLPWILKSVFLTALILAFSGCFLNDGPYPEATEGETPVPTITPPAIVSFSAASEKIVQGESTDLSWDIENADHVVIEPGIGEVDAEGSVAVNPSETTTYTVTATTEGAEPVQASFTVEVETPPPPPDIPDEPDLPPPPPDPCEGMPQTPSALGAFVQFRVWPSVVLEGEPVHVQWSVSLNSEDLSVQLNLGGQMVSQQESGTHSRVMEADASYRLDVGNCGVNLARNLPVDVLSWERSDVTGVSELHSAGLGKPIWAGKADGSLHRSADGGVSWQKTADPRIKGASQARDTTPITAILEMNSGCPGTVFIGTEGAYLYRSTDGGTTTQGFNGAEGPLVIFTGVRAPNQPASAPLPPSPVRFILQDPADARRIYIGHQEGLYRLNACDATSTASFEGIRSPASDYGFSGTQVSLGTVHDGKVYVANQDGLRWSVNGAQWAPVSEVGPQVEWIQPSGNYLYVGTPDSIWRLNGTQWSELALEGTNAAATTAYFTLAAQGSQLQITRNAGADWIPVRDLGDAIRDFDAFYTGSRSYAIFAHTAGGEIHRLRLPLLLVRPRPFDLIVTGAAGLRDALDRERSLDD